MQREFKGVIFTNHALARLKQRKIKQGDAWATLKRPDQSRRGETSGSWVFHKTYGKTRVEVVAKKNDKRQWVVLSVWSKEFDGKHWKRRQHWLMRLVKWLLFGKAR